jgi:2-polyprenyl-3-methyl-5-hydroxy-6-metoxy-1,4-benzoquinol methylase
MSEQACALCGSARLKPGRAGLSVCGECGLAGDYPLPDQDELNEFYTKDYYEAWGREGGEDPAVRTMKQATFASRLEPLKPLPRGVRVLDVGCATGYFLDLVAAAGGEPYGVEISPYAARIAGDRFPGRVTQGTLDQAAYPDGHFHAVFMSDVIEHVPHPDRLLAETYRITAPEGWVVICTPDFGSVSARVLGRRWFHRKREHIIYFTAATIQGGLERAGFTAVRVRKGVKSMTIRYLASHFRTYRLFPVTGVLNLLERFLPFGLAGRTIPLPSGEIVALARKPAGTPAASTGKDDRDRS